MRRNALVLIVLLASLAAPAAAQATCDDLDPSACLLPFPNDSFTKADPSTPTGRRVDFSPLDMPRNAAGKPIDPTDWNRADGFSPGSLIVTKVPGLDLAKTGAVPITDLAKAYDEDAPIVLLDADTGKRALIWSELDMSVPAADRALLVRPGKNLREGHRYIVALRNLRDANGKLIPAQKAFAALRDGTDRSARFERIFRTLRRHGIRRRSLYLAWDFTVASAQSIAGRMLSMRDDAFAQLGDRDLKDMKVAGDAPRFTIDKVVEAACSAGVPVDDLNQGLVARCPDTNEKIVRDVQGSMIVPCYLSTPGCAPAHSHFILGSGDKPLQVPGNVMKVDFECRIPKTALEQGAGRSRPSLYGHGLFGSLDEVRQGQLQDFGVEHNFTFCATDWAGMATTDVPNVATILTDLSNFNTLADRVQQGMLNFLYLGRLMIHPDGLSTDPAFQDAAGRSLLDTRRLFYDGNSQGGIIGGALTAVAPDFDRATLGVPGMNYSTLLTRSSDFGTGQPPTSGEVEYAWPLYTSYPDTSQRQLIFSLMQMLWDRAEPDGYASHMTTRPYPNTPEHRVMLHVALGDHQVAPVSADVEARTIGAKLLRRPAEAPGRNAAREPHYGIPAFGSLPARGSALVIWDSGEPVAPTTNTAPEDGDDPHEFPRRTPAARAMKSAFLSLDSQVVDTCGGAPCRTSSYKPPSG